MSVQTFDELAEDQKANIFKALRQVVMIRPRDAEVAVADPVTTLVNPSGGFIVPAGFHRIGLLRKGEGAEFTRELDTEDVESEGYRSPTHRGIATDARGLTFTAQETVRRAVMALAENLPYDFQVTDTASGWTVKLGEAQDMAHWEVLVVGQQGARVQWAYFPDMTLSGSDSFKFGMGEESVRKIELAAYYDTFQSAMMVWGFEGEGYSRTEVRESLGYPSATTQGGAVPAA